MSKTVIIAEAGVNHNGSMELAKKLVDAAAESGADYVKFQTFKADKIASKSAAKAAYQKETTNAEEGQLQMLKKLELTEENHRELIEYCKQRSVNFLSTPFDLESIDLLKELGVTIGKIPSGEITNLPYLRKMGQTFSTIILSTGMSTLTEIEEAIEVLAQAGVDKKDLIVLHCNTEYPTPMKDVNLLAMREMAVKLEVETGYSDHTQGNEVPIAAVALGAVLIEKHFTLDRTMEGPDHRASLEPDELKAMVRAIRNIEAALGSGFKQPSPSEAKNKAIARKSLVAAKKMDKGHILQPNDLTTKRPGTGISPMLIESVVGKRLAQPINEDDLLTYEHLTV